MSTADMDWIERFEIPDAALPVIDAILRPEEITLIMALGGMIFDAAQARFLLEEYTKTPWEPERAEGLLLSAYRRGVINTHNEDLALFSIGTFYGRLDVFAVREQETYAAFPYAVRKALDEWYFDAYVKGLGNQKQPTRDRVAALQETLDFIDREQRQIFHTKCDCRCLGGECGKPLNTCLSMRSGPNTFASRGVSRPVGKEEAKKIIQKAHEAGLIQTINPNGICNCCGDCCYLFRAQAVRKSIGIWPEAKLIAAFEKDACIACGQCAQRCPFQAFSLRDGETVFEADLCRGCGLCESACPTDAIRMTERQRPPAGVNQ